MKSVKPLVNTKHIELAQEVRRSGVQSLRPACRSSSNKEGNKPNSYKRKADNDNVPTRKSQRLSVHEKSCNMSILYNSEYDNSNSNQMRTDIDVDLETLLHDNSHVHKLVEHAMLGDSLSSFVMKNEFACVTLNPEPQTINQALSLPDRQAWKEAIDLELQMIKDFNVFSELMLLPPGAKVFNQRWVFKRKRDELGNVIKHKARTLF